MPEQVLNAVLFSIAPLAAMAVAGPVPVWRGSGARARSYCRINALHGFMSGSKKIRELKAGVMAQSHGGMRFSVAVILKRSECERPEST
jgi:hypothetical protein